MENKELEKDMPVELEDGTMETVSGGRTGDTCICPKCGETIRIGTGLHCPRCGQQYLLITQPWAF